MELFALEEQICLTPEAANRNASFPQGRVKNLGVLASIAAHFIVLSLLAVSPAAQTIPSFDIIRVNIVQDASPSPVREPSSKPAVKQQKEPIHQSNIAEASSQAFANPAKQQDILETPQRTEPEQKIIPTPDKAQPQIVLASAATENGPGNLRNPVMSVAGRGPVENGAAVAGLSGRTGETTGMGYQAPLETTFGAPNAPAFIYRKMPVYPRLAERLGREGKVVLKLFIDEQGQLHHVQVVESTWQGFTDAALDAVRKSSFSPGRRNGRSVFSEALLAVRFSMK